LFLTLTDQYFQLIVRLASIADLIFSSAGNILLDVSEAAAMMRYLDSTGGDLEVAYYAWNMNGIFNTV
jgi:hypothetical protein